MGDEGKGYKISLTRQIKVVCSPDLGVQPPTYILVSYGGSVLSVYEFTLVVCKSLDDSLLH